LGAVFNRDPWALGGEEITSGKDNEVMKVRKEMIWRTQNYGMRLEAH
jgi:hypothetical protein